MKTKMKTKRKYTRKVSSEVVQGVSMPVKEESSIILPLNIQEAIRRTLELRKRLGLFDDSAERYERAIRYWQNH